MRYARLTAALVAVAAMVIMWSSAAPASSGRLHPFRIQTYPAVAGAHFVFNGQTIVTNRAGVGTFFATTAELRENPLGLSRSVRFIPRVRRDGSIFRFQRWYSKSLNGVRTLEATLREYVPTRIRFANSSSKNFSARKIGEVVSRRSDGAVFTFRGSDLLRPVMLQATRVVPLNSGLVSKNLLYRVLAVTIDGNNVVNRSQQAFEPARTPNVTLKLLFYSVRFSVRDRLFGFGLGSSIRLRYPNGRVHTYRLDGANRVEIPALPRGSYRATVHAPGIRTTIPVAMTRDQVVTLKVFSYLDVAVVIAVLLAVAVGLLLVGRPNLRARVRGLVRWKRPTERETARA